MDEARAMSWRNPWFRWSVVSLTVLTVVSILVGFLWLPSVQRDFREDGWWAALCRAAGVPASWSEPSKAVAGPRATRVVLTRAMARPAEHGSAGRGATLALAQCTMCHGAQGMSASNAPNLAGQYPEVVIKQMQDYRDGRRTSAVMQAIAAQLADQDLADLAAYYAGLPQARTAPTFYDESLPALVRVGDPLRNIAPCISCHGGVDQKLGAPWMEGMPKAYLVEQLRAFASGRRQNDPHAQMRNVARAMTEREIDAVASFYAGKAAPGGH